MDTDKKIVIGVLGVTALIVVGAIFFLNKTNKGAGVANVAVAQEYLIRDNSNKIATDSAKVTLVEFGDFQCPSCRLAHPTIKEVMGEYTGRLNFVFRNFPLMSVHKNAFAAAKAAEAAGKQNKYWEMHNVLYEKQTEWEAVNNADEVFLGYAQSLQLDPEKFKQDYDSEEVRTKIQDDIDDANKLGVNSTPTLYVNGVELRDFQKQTIVTAIESHLK